MRARWHQLLKLSWVSDENSRDSVRAEVPTARASASISCEAVGSASTMSAARRQRGSCGSPAPLRRGDLHRALGGIYQLRLAVHVGVEPDALSVAACHQMHAIAGRAMARPDGSDWHFRDTHWPHP